MFIIKLSISTCFGHHYAHHQENTRSVLVVNMVGSPRVYFFFGHVCTHVFTTRTLRLSHLVFSSPYRHNIACSKTRSYSPDDGHNDA